MLKQEKVSIIIALLLIIVFMVIVSFGVKFMLSPSNIHIEKKNSEEDEEYRKSISNELNNMKTGYDDPEAPSKRKEAIKNMITYEFTNYDITQLPQEQQDFIKRVRGY